MPAAVAAHDRIIAALAAGDLDRACRELEGNLVRGQAPVLEWLSERDRREGDK